MGKHIYKELLVKYKQSITGPSNGRQKIPLNECAAGARYETLYFVKVFSRNISILI